MNVADILKSEGKVIFSEDEIEDVVTYLYNQLNDCKIMAFSGPLGAGKTTLIRALLHKCGIKGPVTSPTFIYVNRYITEDGKIFYHFDLYRIKSLFDFLDAGFDEYFYEPNSWCFIEWPEVIKPVLPSGTCFIMLNYHNDKRELQIKKL
jgi:tRNA threonylcarbamoyladenosine biosynthesis protein TsaE